MKGVAMGLSSIRDRLTILATNWGAWNTAVCALKQRAWKLKKSSRVAVMNYTDLPETPYTRSIEHKHFEFGTQPVTYVTKEYPADWKPGEEAYYPVNNERNQKLYEQYAELAAKEENVIFGGRLAEYK